MRSGLINYEKEYFHIYFIRGAVNVCLISPGAQSPGLGSPLRNASACSGSLADRDRRSARNSFLLGLSGSLRLGEPSGPTRTWSGQTRLGADREYASLPWNSALSVTSLSGNAKYDGLSETKFILNFYKVKQYSYFVYFQLLDKGNRRRGDQSENAITGGLALGRFVASSLIFWQLLMKTL